jgi:mannose-6-phosphate isomerase-like protein (cupin superfamily)
MTRSDAHKVCKDILDIPFEWLPPETSDDPLYVAHSHSKAHVELLGPDGIIQSNNVRLGLYGILPNSEYGIRTHPAEEVFIMLAGEADWLRETENYHVKHVGEYSYHPSGMHHATKTNHLAFMSVYIWTGDVSTEGYRYLGIPN